MSVRPTVRIFMKFDIGVFFEILPRPFKFHENLTRITGTLHGNQYAFLIISPSVLIRMRNVSDKRCRGNYNTHFMFNNYEYFSKIIPFIRYFGKIL